VSTPRIWSKEVHTPAGLIVVQGPVPSTLLETMTMDQGLTAFRPPHKQIQALIEISRLENGRIIIASLGETIIGYVTFHPPDEFERWAMGPKETLELGAIEVAPPFRNYKIGKTLLEVAFMDPSMEKHLIIVTEYFWHWDLEGLGLHVWEYRDLMQRLMAHVGMVVKDTDDEEICAHPANILMVRYGRDLSPEAIETFEKILFLNS